MKKIEKFCGNNDDDYGNDDEGKDRVRDRVKDKATENARRIRLK